MTAQQGTTRPPGDFIAARVRDMAPSPTIAVSDKARALKAQGVDVVDLGGGDPDFITPEHIRQAAADAGRPEPRIHVTLPVLVTDDVDAARRRAGQVFAVYDSLPSYKAMMDREGVDGPGGIAIVGTESEVADQVRALAALGVTDFGVGVFASNPDEEAATIAAVRAAVG